MQQSHTLHISEMSVQELERGFRGTINLQLFDTHRGTVTLPALIASGHHQGPVLLAVAGIHGNEYEGQEAIRTVFEQLDPAELNGTFFGIPVCNIFAYESRTRSTPDYLDGLNLARIFPGNEHGSPSERLAYALMHLVTRNLGPNDLFIDFHSANEAGNYITMVGFRDIPSPARVRSEEAARHFAGCPLFVFGNQHGMFNAEVSRAGIPTIGTETTGQAGCRPEDVKTFATGLRDMLRFQRMTEGPSARRSDAPLHQGFSLESPATGFLRLRHGIGDYVHAGETLGEIVAIAGDRIAAVTSPSAGTIWMRRTSPAVRAGELVCVIAAPETERS